MLALILSGAVALASLVFFSSAFFAPKLHRKDDFLWSGFGFFYGLVLWNCAQRLTGAVLLGQLVAVILILAFAWQTLKLRAAIAKNAIAEVPSFSLLDWVGGGLKRKPKAPAVVPGKVKEKVAKEKAAKTEEQPGKEAPEPTDQREQTEVAVGEVAEILTETAEDMVEELNAAAEIIAEKVMETAEEIVESAPPKQPQAKVKPEKSAEVPLKKPKSKLFQRLFGGKKKPEPGVDVVEPVVNLPESEADDEDWGEEPEVSVSEDQENQAVQVAPVSEAVEEIAEVTEKIVEEVEKVKEMAVEGIATSVEEETTPAPEESPAPTMEESVGESLESIESAPRECKDNKVPEAYAAYVEPEDPAEALADEPKPNGNDQDKAP